MMRLFLFTIAMFLFGLNATAQSTTYKYKDIHGNSYKTMSSLYEDSDGDGYLNIYDRHDTNPNVNIGSSYGTYNTYDYNSSSYDIGSSRTIYVGPRGGRYYINSNGNKTYVKD